MARKMSRMELFAGIFILFIFFCNVAAQNMLIPAYVTITNQWNVSNSAILIPDAMFTVFTALFSVLWGYYVDRIDRSKVLMGGSFISTVGFLFTAFAPNFSYLILSRIISGVGLGCVLPVGFSILGNLVPQEERNRWFGFVAIFSSISNGIGNALQAFLGSLLGWQTPFLFLSVLSVVIIFLSLFVKFPSVGSMEEDLNELRQMKELQYGYQINYQELKKMMKKPTNKYLTISGFFSIVPGTLLIFSLIYCLNNTSIGMFRYLPSTIVLQVSTIMAGLVGAGYLVGNSVISYFTDKYYKKDRRTRAKMSYIIQH